MFIGVIYVFIRVYKFDAVCYMFLYKFLPVVIGFILVSYVLYRFCIGLCMFYIGFI